VNDDQFRRCMAILKAMSSLRLPPYDLPADSFLQVAVLDIEKVIVEESPSVGFTRPNHGS